MEKESREMNWPKVFKGTVFIKKFLAFRAQNNSSNVDHDIWVVGTFGGLIPLKRVNPFGDS